MKNYISLLINSGPFPKGNTSDLSKILNAALELAGALAMLMLVIGGLRYIISGGNPEKTATSKRMIAYSLVGLVVIALASVIVNLVLNRL